MQTMTEALAPDTILQRVRMRQTPFPHFIAWRPFAPAAIDAAHAWLHTSALWRRHASSFFDQFELRLVPATMHGPLHGHVASPATTDLLRQRMQDLFSVRLADTVTVVAHRLVAGQGIGVHTDKPHKGSETHRLVVHLGPDRDDAGGGHLMFFHSQDPGDIACAFRNIHNTAVGFELSTRSYHAVSDLRSGVRYTLVYSFWHAD